MKTSNPARSSILPSHPYVLPHTNIWRRDLSAACDKDDNPESAFQEIVGNSHMCFALYIECVPHSTQEGNKVPSSPSSLPTQPPTIVPIIQPHLKPSVILEYNATHINTSESVVVSEEEHWTWSASIYVDGKLICVGVLVDKFWVLTEKSCIETVKLDFDYVVVVLGGSKPYLHVHSLYEQVIRVNCIIKLQDDSSTVMLYLERPAHYNRQCLPTFLPDM